MKKSYLMVMMLLVVAVFFTYGATTPEDPTGTMQKIQALNDAHKAEIQTVLDKIQMDFHPEYGTVKAEEYPVNAKGVTLKDAEAMARKELEGNGYSILEINTTEKFLSGPALAEHCINNRQVYVWHNYNQTPIYVTEAMVSQGGYCYRWVRVWIQTCSNGAGYWSWVYKRVPCGGLHPYTYDYYSNSFELVAYNREYTPMRPPDIDPTGTVQKIYELNMAHRGKIDELIKNVSLDEHPVYGDIRSEAYPVNPAGMNVDDAYNLIYKETEGMTLADVQVEERTFSGRALVEHVIDGNQVFVWHEMDNEPIVYATAITTNAPDGACYMVKLVWVNGCANGLQGRWVKVRIRIPCASDKANAVDYSRPDWHLKPYDIED